MARRPTRAEYEIGDRREISKKEFDSSQTQRYRMIIAVDLSYHWQEAHDGVLNHGASPALRLQVTPIQQCVDLMTTEASSVSIWKDIGEARFAEIEMSGVSPALDRLLLEHCGERRPPSS